MATKKLTPELVEAATGNPRKQQVFVWDKQTAGLGLRITRRGKKTWVYRYSLEGRDRRMALDPWPKMDLEAARTKAVELQARVQRGEDPAREPEPTGDGRPTLGDLWRKFEERHLPKKSEGHARNLRDQFERLILPHFKETTPLDSITWEDVDAWHHELGERTPTQANRALAALRKAFNLAPRYGLVERGTLNPAVDHDLKAERRPGRPFTGKELAKIATAITKEADPILRAALQVYFLNPLRPGEVCRLRWEDLREDGTTFLGETKTGERVAILSTRAEKIIREIPRTSTYVFPGKSTGEPLGGSNASHGLGNAWKRIAERAELGKGRRLYDQRHTWVSTAAALGIGDDVRRVIAGHAGGSGTAHGVYLHAIPELRKAADQVAERLAAALGLTEHAEAA